MLVLLDGKVRVAGESHHSPQIYSNEFVDQPSKRRSTQHLVHMMTRSRRKAYCLVDAGHPFDTKLDIVRFHPVSGDL